MKEKILVIVAHPDDEVLGCAGTVARLVKEGHSAYSLILGEGITSRGIKQDAARDKVARLKVQAKKSAAILGISKTFFFDFSDNRFDTVPFLDLVKAIEQVKAQVGPGIIFTHNPTDLNIDHRLTYNAVMTAFRAQPGEKAKEIYSFEVPSSTNWHYPYFFTPDVFFDIAPTLRRKIKALSMYRGELRRFPHPRSLRGVELNAQYWGMHAGIEYAEAFKTIRVLR